MLSNKKEVSSTFLNIHKELYYLVYMLSVISFNIIKVTSF